MKKIIADTLSLLEFNERRQLYFYAVLDVIITMTDIASLVLLLYILNFYTQPFHITTLSSFLPAVFNDRSSVLLIAVFLLFFTGKNIIAYTVHQSRFQFYYKIASRIAEKNLLRYLEGNYNAYVMVDSAVQIRKISQEPIEFSHYVLAGILQIISQSILVGISITTILVFNASLFLLLFIVLLPPIVLIIKLAKQRTRHARTQAKKSSENSLQYLKEALNSFVEANIYGKLDFFVRRYSTWQKKLNAHLSDIQAAQAMPNRMIEIFAVAGLFMLIALNKWTGDLNPTAMINIGAFMAAAYKIMPAAVQILNSNSQVKAYAFSVNDLVQIQSAATTPGTPKPTTPIENISFRNIGFRYDKQNILHDFNACMKKGDFIGIKGKSGRGKTTIIHLLLGFLEPDYGIVKINDIPATEISGQHYWNQIAYVKQQTFLVHDTVLTNITLDNNDYDHERMEEVINITGLGTYAEKTGIGLQTIVTENGKNISGGQRQRIGIARALYKNADLIILDEPFNELDRVSENALLKHFCKLTESGKMVILITHDKESLCYCNKIISLDEK